jgi:hypothetical protein
MRVKYTFTFKPEDEFSFKDCLARLDEDEYTVLQPITPIPEEVTKYGERYASKSTVVEMEPDACLTFRLGMKKVGIRRERSEEELVAEKARDDKNKITIRVQVPPGTPGVGPAPTTTP